MGNIGIGEIAVLLLLAMLVFGPNKLPEIARGLGKGIRAFQQESRRAADVFRTALDEPPKTAGVIDSPEGVAAAPVAKPPAPPRPAPAPVDPELRRLEDT